MQTTVNQVIFDAMELDEEDYDIERDRLITALENLIDRYEQRHKTIVEDLVLAGSVGTWRGRFPGGKVVSSVEDIFYTLGNGTYLKVVVDDDDSLVFLGIHHDGTHRFNLYLLTKNKKRKLGLSQSSKYWGYPEIEKVMDTRHVKVDRPFKAEFGLA